MKSQYACRGSVSQEMGPLRLRWYMFRQSFPDIYFGGEIDNRSYDGRKALLNSELDIYVIWWIRENLHLNIKI